jgi:hypothetical protein
MIGAVELAADEQTQVKNFINRRYFEAYQTSPVWPRYVKVGDERIIIALVLTGSSTAAVNQNYKILGENSNGSGVVYQGITEDDIIIYNTGSAWRIDDVTSVSDPAEQSDGRYTVTSGTQRHIETDTVKKSSAAEVENWNPSGLVVTEKNLIPYTQSGKDTMSDVVRLHRQHPFLNRSALEYDFFVDVDGANILNLVPTTENKAFATYKKKFDTFTVSSDFYNSTTEVPEEFFNYIAHAVYADFLRVQNKQEEAIAEENIAKGYLDQELEKADAAMSNVTLLRRINTHTSRQSR